MNLRVGHSHEMTSNQDITKDYNIAFDFDNEDRKMRRSFITNRFILDIA